MPDRENLFKKVSLDTICNGAIRELFDREMKNVTKNIADPNIAPAAKRSITIQIVFSPNEDRQTGAVSANIATKLPGVRPATAPIFFGKDTTGPAAFQNDPQLALPGTTEEVPNIGRKG